MKLAMSMMVLALACLPAGAGAAGQTEESVDNFVFVGQLLSIEELPDPCEQKQEETGELTCITMDSLYRARYRVLQRIAGSYPGDVITFDIADHYGFPKFARYRNAVLFVGLYDDRPWLHKYQGIAVHRTVAGQWASCGEIEYRRKGEPVPPQVKPLRFEHDIASVGEISEAGWMEILRDWQTSHEAMDHRIERGRIRCTRGILLEDLYDIVRDGVMRARGVVLPPSGIN